MTDDQSDDLRITMARVEGMLSAVLPQHGARLDEHDKALTNLGATVVQQGQAIAGLEATQTRASQTPAWVPVIGALAAIGALITTIAVLIFTH